MEKRKTFRSRQGYLGTTTTLLNLCWALRMLSYLVLLIPKKRFDLNARLPASSTPPPPSISLLFLFRSRPLLRLGTFRLLFVKALGSSSTPSS